MKAFRAAAFLALGLVSSVFSASRAAADEIAAADLQIQGAGLKVVNVSVATGVNIPAAVQTEFGGKQNDQAPVVEGLLAVGELSGPGIDVPIRLETAPGQKFQVPGLQREGVYFLQNIRLMKGDDFLQSATPSVATVTVSNLLQTSVKVRQLTAEEIRARGISVDARNYDVYEYTFSFLVDGVIVEIPFPVIIDPRTHEVRQVPDVVPWGLPPVDKVMPPRWFPPEIFTFEMAPPPEAQPPTRDDPVRGGTSGRISIPAALVIPNNLAVLHQFFAVTLMVTNGAPEGSTVSLDDITAQMKPPSQLRTVKSLPPVAFNQPVPIVDAANGVRFLVAQARGEAEWTMEALQTGTHTLEVEVKATYKSPGQTDFPLKGTVRASVVVHDPRFNVNFSHPDVVRKDIEYSTYSFITNMSPALQNIRVSNGVPACAESPGANVCRVDGTPAFHDLTIPSGEMRSIEYKLRPGITGNVFATAGSVEGDAVTAQVALHMGVSESGIPLSPATLIMPYYARYVGQPMVSANLQLLGLGYSLATAPMSAALAKHPRIIKTDVFRRATDIARAGQRVFLGEPMRDSLAHMTLDLLGNAIELREWDDLRRAEKSARTGSASIARELEAATAGDASLDVFVSQFATQTAWRAPYLLAVTSAGKLSVRDTTSNARMDVASEAASGWIRQLPWGEINTFRGGELAVVGRWAGDYEVTVTPTADGPFTLDLILPNAAEGSVLRARFSATGVAGQPLRVVVTKGAQSLELRDSLGGIAAVGTISSVAPAPLAIIGARQDLNLDAGGHKVSILWNRPVGVTGDLLAKLSAQVVLDRDNVHYEGPRPMSAAALQDGARVANVTFDHALSQNAGYSMTVGSLTDPIGGAPVSFPTAIVPVIDNDAPGGIIYGHVLKGDNSPIGDAEVRLYLERDAGPPQFDSSRASDGAFLFEFVPRDIDNDLPGTYKLEGVTPDLKITSVEGAVRLPGRVHLVNLVFLGRGAAEGTVRYDNGQVVPNAKVVIGSTMFDQFRNAVTDANGRYSVDDLPVGPLTFSATDEDGNVTFAASEIRTPGQLLQQDLSIYRRPFPGTGTIRGVVKRSDTGAAVPYAQVGVYSQGYGLMDGFADGSGRFEFRKVPVGFITVLAAEWTLSRISTAIDFDLNANEVRDVTLTLDVQPAEALVVIEGDVLRENPLYPGDASKYEKVAGAVVKLEKGQAVTADANGHFVFTSVPVSFSTKKITAYDPISTRSVTNTIQQLDPSKVNLIPMFIATANGYGQGTIRVRILDAAGYPVTGMRVIEPAWPPYVPKDLVPKPDGVYLLENVPVGGITRIWAISNGGQYGDQAVTGETKVEFNGHIASLNFRLPGQGTVRVKLAADVDAIGDVKIVYPAWEEADMALAPKELVRSTSENGVAGYATFTGVPALQDFTVSSTHPVYGYAAQTGRVAFDGEVRSITLQLNKLSTVRGVVYAIDGRTPVPGAAVRIEDGKQNQGIQTTLPDGSYEFRNVAAGVNFRVIAEITQDGTYRTGVASGNTPATGGLISGLPVILRTQGSLEGRIVYAGFKVFDPQNPANNVVDNTPSDLSDNAPVPLANFSLRELDFPYRSFGTLNDPITADVAGRFNINNVFTGPLRLTAVDPGNQENRGTWTGAIGQEGEKVTALIGIGAEGFGPVSVRVLDPNAQNAPVLNAEVTLTKATHPFAKFDLSSTDANGIVTFEQVPVGSYKVTAYSKALGRSGGSAAFTVANITGASVDVVLEFSGSVDGTLTDPEDAGRGVPGAPVTLTEDSFQTRASTDVDGNFVFQGVREGQFKLEAKDTLTNRRATATRNLTQADPSPTVDLQLEPTETLHVSVYLPNDAGGNSNILAPLVSLDVRQRNDDFKRVLQGNAFEMPGLFENEKYSIAIKELGGDQRTISATNSFPVGSAANPLKLVLPAYGSVEVKVVQGSTPAANARVNVSGSSKQVTAYTDATGTAVVNGIPLGPVYVQVVSVDNAFSGSASATLASQSTPAVVQIALGAYAGLSGLVDAETGGPSIGTRVVAQWGTRILEAFTDASGRFTFQGIPTGSTVTVTYIGPDDVTVGAKQTVVITAADASKVVEAPKVKLDATPPQVAGFFPADNAANVSPDSTIRITFSERIGASYVNSTHLQLLPADSATPVAAAYASAVNADGTFTVTLTPPAPPAGQNFPLKSNTLYRIVVSAEIRDLTGNKIPAARGASFITSDYAEPKVLKVVPSPTTAIQASTTFEFRFNEPIDPAPWQNGGASLRFYKISQHGETGTVIAEKQGSAYVGPTGLSLFFAPAEAIEQESFYRITFSGVRDLQGNLLGTQTFHFFSYDLVKPFVTIVSPVPDGFPLISGVEYTPAVELRNGGATSPLATDIARVDYFRVDGTVQTHTFAAMAAPWTYRFVAPDTVAEGATFTLRAIATDHSGNVSDAGDFTWPLRANAAPQNVAVALTPATSIYPGNIATAAVTFEDEGTQVTVQLEATAIHADGSEYKSSQVKTATRTKVSDAWPTTSFTFDLPGTLKQGTRVTFTATATDMRGLKGTGSEGLDLTVDTVAPEVLTLAPPAQSRYNIGQKFQSIATVRDAETGVASVTFSFDNQTVTVTRPSTKVVSLGNQTWTFNSGDITVPAKNVDTAVTITATAKDYGDNVVSKSTEVVYVGVNDPTVPKGAWLCPVEKAVYPAGKTLPVKLQVRATDDIAVTAVKFTIPGVATPVSATRVGTTDVYETNATLTFPAAGEKLTVIATISDADATHDVELPVVLESVAVDIEIDGRTQPVLNATEAATYADKTVLVRGTLGRFVPHVPVSVKNLIVLEGALVDTLATTTTTERKLDLTVTDRLYVDCASRIDVTALGYLGGYGANYDGSGTNADSRGRTIGNTNTGGATTFSSGSHGGLGGSDSATGIPNEPYGSITDPLHPGAGGGGATNGTSGAAGGGVVKLQGGTFAIAGAIRADGGSRFGSAHAGAGGSVNIRGSQLIVSPAGRITANGGDDDDINNTSRGAGGGRVAIEVTDRLDVEALGTQIQSRGGRNGTTDEGATRLDGGAGTIFILRPGQVLGELFAGSQDERFPLTTHLTRPTPLAGTLRFDKVTIGRRALVRADASLDVGGVIDTKSAATVDPSAVLILNGEIPTLQATTTPAADGSLIQTTALGVNYIAASAAGIGKVQLAFTPIATDRVDSHNAYPASVAPAVVNLTVPADATPGAATLTVTATDRAGRSTQLAPLAYTIVANTAAVIDAFSATPAEVYPGKTVTATVSAHDDVKVTRLVLTRTIGTGTPATSIHNANAQTVTNHAFSVPIDINTPGGQTLTLELAAEDGYPSRAATKETRTVTILRDLVPPAVTINLPADNALFNEGTGNSIQVRATIADAEVGVKEAFVQITGGAAVAMTKSGTEYVATLPVPNVDGTEIVTRTLTVTGKDYEGNAETKSVTIRIQPINDPNAPVVSWSCPTAGAVFPAGVSTRLLVYALGNNAGNTANGVQKVELFVDDSTTPIAATAVTGQPNYYQATYAIPAAAAANSTISIRAVATNASGVSETATTSFTIIVADRTITTDTTITASDATWDNKVIVVQSGTATILGEHTFTRLVVLGGAKVTHPATDATTIHRLNVTATAGIFVACDGSIDVSSRGFSGAAGGYGRTWPNTTTGGSYNGAGGSHGGRGGTHDAHGDSALTYGSIHDPNTPGGAGGYYSNGNCNPCNAGGGVARLEAPSVIVDGKLLSNGQHSSGTGTGAGGSIRVDAETLAGGGEIRADGAPTYWTAAGGGRISLHYQSLEMDRSRISAAGGLHSGNSPRTGTAGTVYLRQNDPSGAKLADELLLANLDRDASRATPLATLGSGTVTAVAGAVVTLSNAVPEWVEGSTIEFLGADEAMLSSYEIVSRTATAVTVRLAAGETTPKVSAGNAYRGLWAFDQVTLRTRGAMEADALRTSMIDSATNALARFGELRASNGLVLSGGRTEVNRMLAAGRVDLQNGGVLTHSPTTSTTINRLNVDVTGAFTVDATSSIDVSAIGFTGSVNGYGRTWQNTATGGSYNGAGGSHGGRGGAHDAHGDSAATYGSVLDPDTPGGAGGYYSNGNCNPCSSGGGVARVKAGSFVLDGKVLANGELHSQRGTGAGGSIRIDAGTISGAGEIHADGAATYWAAAGGGRVALYYQTLELDPLKITAAGGLHSGNSTRTGAAGTVYRRQVDASGAKVSDELVIDNLDRVAIRPTTLPIIGSGTVTAVSGAVVTLSATVPEWIEGATIEFLDATGAVLSTYEIVSRTGTTVTLKLPAGQTAPNVAAGNAYRGIWPFEQVTARRQGTLEMGPVRSPLLATSGASFVRIDELLGTDIVIRGAIETNKVVANSLDLQNGAVLSHPATTATTIRSLVVDVDGPITIDATSSIDVSARGFSGSTGGYGRTWPNVTTGGSYNGAGGSHGGRGGTHDSHGDSAPTYGSFVDPDTPGGAGGYYSNGTCSPCNAGGGIARITAESITLNGKIQSNGELTSQRGTGAGGSIRIDAESITGSGEIHADGAPTYWTAGGGGRVAVYYQTLGIDRAKITAAGGLHSGNTTRTGAPGTVFLKRDTQPSGELIVDNGTRPTTRLTTLPSVGYRTVSEAGTDFLRDTTASFIGPDHLKDIHAFVNHDRTKSWPIVANDDKTLRLDVSAQPVIAQTGQSLRGIYKLDALKLRNATLDVHDVLDVATAVDKDTASIVRGANNAPPAVTASLITLESTPTGAAVVGAAGAAIDTDAPVTAYATNTATGNVYTTTVVQADGSFAIPVQGSAGDPITFKVRDGNVYFLESPVIAIGTLPSSTPVPSQIAKSTWNVDTAFLSRTLSRDGSIVAVASMPPAHSDRLVLLSVSDPAYPNLLRTVPSGSGGIRDVVLQNGWAYIGADRLATLNLNDPAALPVFATGSNQCGSDTGVVVVDGLAFTAMNECYTDGYINIYDVATPSSPRWMRTEGMHPGQGVAYSDLLLLGTDYLVALSPNKTGTVGHDVVVIDRRNVYDLQKVADFDIPAFDSFRGTIVGSTLYVVSQTTPRFTIVDLSNPAAPAVLGSVALQSVAGGVYVIGQNAFVANGASGLATIDISNPASPTLVGVTPVTGNSFDVNVAGGYAYVANEIGLALVPAAFPPQIHVSRIGMSLTGTTVTVTGEPQSVSGSMPVTVQLTNAATGAQLSGVPVQSDGSFTAQLEASPDDGITIKATDSDGRFNGPLSIGKVPFGSSTRVLPIDQVSTDLGFAARNVATSGNHLVVASNIQDGGSDKLVIFDVTDRANPVRQRVVASGVGLVRDIAIHGDLLIIGGDRVATLDLSNPASAIVLATGSNQCGSDWALEVAGGYLFTAMGQCYADGYINVYEIATGTAARWINTESLAGSGHTITGLAALGTDYLVAVNNHQNDLIVVDRRELSDLKKVVEFDIPSFTGQNVKVAGTRAYITGTNGTIAVVDLTNPASPVLVSTGIVRTQGWARALDVLGTTVAVADSTAGVSFLNISGSGLPAILGNQLIGGTAWECAFNGSTLYVANQVGVVVIDALGTPPLIDRALITTSGDGAGTATATGVARSILGHGPVTLELRNAATEANEQVTVAADGSFTATVSGTPGQPLTLLATDAVGRVSGPLSIGIVPFGAVTRHFPIPNSMTDATFMARNLVVQGNDLVVADYANSDKLVLFDASTPGNPAYKRTLPAVVTGVRDLAIHAGWLVIGGDRVATLNLADPAATPVVATGSNQCGYDTGLQLSGGFLFTAMSDCYTDGYVNVYDVSSPSAPRWVSTQAVGGGNNNAFTDLALLGTNYLIGVGGVAHDVTIVDRRDVHSLKFIRHFDIANFEPFQAKVVGNILYLAGVEDGVAAVDLTDPTAPVLLGIVSSLGSAISFDDAGTMLAVANGMSGISFVDYTAPSAPFVAGAHPLPGVAWEVALSRGALYAVTESGLASVANVATPPMLDQSLLTITPAATSTSIAGAAYAITGIGPISVAVRNDTTSATTTPVAVAANGSFTASVNVTPGQPLSLVATDAGGRVSIRSIGSTYGATKSQRANPAVSGDANFRARRVVSNGNVTLVTSGMAYGTHATSNRLLLFGTDPTAAPTVITSTISGIQDVQIQSGYAYFGGDRVAAIDLADPAYTTRIATGSNQCGSDASLAVTGRYLYAAMNDCYSSAYVNVYDLVNPAIPAWVSTQQIGGFGNTTWRKLVGYGASHLVALTTDKEGGVERDVVVIDRTNPMALIKIAELAIPSFEPVEAVVDGTTLYVTGNDNGLAIVDLSNPAQPQLRSKIKTAGNARELAVSGPNEIVVADASAGVTFVNVTDKANPIITGTQKFGGNVVAVEVAGKNVHVAAENHYHLIQRP